MQSPIIDLLSNKEEFPLPEELLPDEWEREKGRRGRQSAEELSAKAAFYRPRRVYTQVLERLAGYKEFVRTLQRELSDALMARDALEVDKDAQLAAANADNAALQDQIETLTGDKEVAAERGELLATVMTQLQSLMPGDEFEPEHVDKLPAHASAPRSNSRITIEVAYGKRLTFENTRLRVTSRDPSLKPLPPIYLDIEGIKPSDVVLIAGYLSVMNGSEMTARARETYKQETSDEEEYNAGTQAGQLPGATSGDASND